MVNSALSYLGTPYLYGGNSYNGIDCSGLTQQSYATVGVSIPRTAQEQYNQSIKIEADQLRPGDLIFEGSDTNNISHVMMYIGNGQAVEAPHAGASVRTTSLNTRSNIVGYGTYGVQAGASAVNLFTNSSQSTSDKILSGVVRFLSVLLLAVIAVVFFFKAFEIKIF